MSDFSVVTQAEVARPMRACQLWLFWGRVAAFAACGPRSASNDDFWL